MPIRYAVCAALLAMLLASVTGGARAEIHRRIDAASGMEVLSNVTTMPAAGPASGPADGAARSKHAAGAMAPALRAGQGQIQGSVMQASASQGKASAMRSGGGQSGARTQAASFPVISRAQQNELDAGRRTILEDELQAERQALQAARSRQAAAEILHRHDMNIAALTRELAGIP